tara:strand:- start:150 stop:965 length:816 start_codon:yes stop_codon:yes gene_type:complete
MEPYLPIRKVPLDYQGVQSNAFSVQMEKPIKEGKGDNQLTINKWKEVGTVSNNYLLVENKDVKDMADQIACQSGIDFVEDKVFFDGKRFVLSYIAKDTSLGEVGVGDDIALGFQMWNSYDGSTSLGFRMMLYRLECLNGMTSQVNLSKYRFRHNHDSENWPKELENVAHSLQSASRGDNNSVHDMINKFKELKSTHIDMFSLGQIRNGFINDIPTQLFGSLVDRFLDKEHNNGWELLNAATDELWHKEKPTVASFKHNATIVDGLCNWVAA